MNRKKITILVMVLLAAVIAFALLNFHIIDFRFYTKNAETLDLRGEEISVAHYESLRQKLPDCVILWDVPFQDGVQSSDAEMLVVKTLSENDIEMLRYFPELETLDATGCEDLSQLAALREAYPQLAVLLELTLDGNSYSQDAKQIRVGSITEEELALLPYLTELTDVTVSDTGDGANLERLYAYCQEQGIAFHVSLNGEVIDGNLETLTVANVTEVQAKLLQFLPRLETLHLTEPAASAQAVTALAETLADTQVTWEKSVLGVTFRSDAAQIDLTDVIARAEGEGSDVKTAYAYALECVTAGTREEVLSSPKVQDAHPLPDKTENTEQLIAELEAAMEYFPNAEKLVLCGAWLNNTAMSDFREAHREDYKVVWSVQCGSLAARTDATLFMPTKYNIQIQHFSDLEAYNLRYCEDMVAIDLGHMVITNLEFARYMPHLKYLILALTYVKDLSPLSACKELVFLEMHWVDRIQDFSPLLECTALEDLNVGETNADITPLLEMTWLKNLWVVGCDGVNYEEVKAALPNTTIGYYYGNPDDGWRNLPNYFAMRDALKMYYMK